MTRSASTSDVDGHHRRHRRVSLHAGQQLGADLELTLPEAGRQASAPVPERRSSVPREAPRAVHPMPRPSSPQELGRPGAAASGTPACPALPPLEEPRDVWQTGMAAWEQASRSGWQETVLAPQARPSRPRTMFTGRRKAKAAVNLIEGHKQGVWAMPFLACAIFHCVKNLREMLLDGPRMDTLKVPSPLGDPSEIIAPWGDERGYRSYAR